MDKQYVVAERGQFMCPNMHFGMLITIHAVFELEKVKRSLEILAQAHPFLRSSMKFEVDGVRLFYNVEDTSKTRLHLCSTQEELQDFYTSIANSAWDIFAAGLLQVCILPTAGRFQVLFIVHHLLGDGRSLLQLVQEFADVYCANQLPATVAECLIQNIDDLPSGSQLPWLNKLLIEVINRQWRKFEEGINYAEYSEFVEVFAADNPIAISHAQMDAKSMQLLRRLCRDNGVSVNDLLMAKTCLKTDSKQIFIAADVRSKIRCYQRGALGNYASGFIVECGNEQDVIKKAKSINKLVKSKLADNKQLMMILSCYLTLEPTLIDVLAIAGLGGLNKSKIAGLLGARMFGFGKRAGVSISNLGAITSRHIETAIFIPTNSPATQLNFGIVTVNNKMNICCSYYKWQTKEQDVLDYLAILTGISDLEATDKVAKRQ